MKEWHNTKYANDSTQIHDTIGQLTANHTLCSADWCVSRYSAFRTTADTRKLSQKQRWESARLQTLILVR